MCPRELSPEVLFEDQHLIVLAKPAGLLSQGEHTGDVNVVDWLRQRFGRPYVGLVHRLDRNTSGIMVVAKRTKAANRLTESLQKGELERTYLAWLVGNLAGPARWSHRLEKNEATNVVRVVKSGGKESALAVTPVKPGKFEGLALTLAEFKLETGRSHQIRVQAAYEGYPLLGDSKYGAKQGAGGLRFGRPALHSHRLSFPHPMGGAPVSFEAKLPEDMAFGDRAAN